MTDHEAVRAAAVEAMARAIHDTDDMANTVWPDSEADDGYRNIGYVRLCQCTELYRQAARAAIAAYEAHMSAAGWVRVPVEPTEAQIEAAMARSETEDIMYHGIYRAMLAARPGAAP